MTRGDNSVITCKNNNKHSGPVKINDIFQRKSSKVNYLAINFSYRRLARLLLRCRCRSGSRSKSIFCATWTSFELEADYNYQFSYEAPSHIVVPLAVTRVSPVYNVALYASYIAMIHSISRPGCLSLLIKTFSSSNYVFLVHTDTF